MAPTTRSTAGENCAWNGAPVKVASQWRRGTPKDPAKVMAIEKTSMPKANR